MLDIDRHLDLLTDRARSSWSAPDLDG
jgi:hypothetical protein